MNYFVYETTNLINGKKYIGKHSCSCKIEEDTYLGSGTLMLKAISKYGRKNFKRKIIKICKNEEEAYEEERKIIEETKANHNELYYNLIEGGRNEKVGHFHVTKNPIILNHDEYIKNLLNSGIQADDTHAKFKIQYIMEYFIINNMSCDNIIAYLSQYAKDYYSEWNVSHVIEDLKAIYEKVIIDKDKLTNKHTDKEITIYESEIEKLKQLDNNNLMNYVLSCLVIYKVLIQYNDETEWVEYRKPFINQLSKIGYNERKIIRQNYNRWLKNHGYINTRNSEKEYYMPFNVNSGTEVIKLKGLDNITLLFRYLEGDEYVIRCKHCGCFFVNNKTKSSKFCQKHRGYIKTGYIFKPCCDCGEVFFIDSRAQSKIRCDRCQLNANRINQKKRNKRYNTKCKIQTEQNETY